MWLPDLSGFPAKPGPDPISLFIAQAWHELLNPSTPDSFRARTLDLPLLLDDLLHITEVAESDSRWNQYLPSLADEIDEALLAEQRLVEVGSQLHTAFAAVVKEAREQKSSSLKKKILVAKGLYGSPSERLGEDLISLLKTGGVKKKAILHRLSTIASHVEYGGLGEESSASIVPELAFLSPPDVVTRLSWSLHASFRQFSCAFAIDGEFSDVRSITAESKFVDATKHKTLGSDAVTAVWLRENEGCFIATSTVSARSPREAAEKQLQSLSEILNVHNLYTNSASFRVRPCVLVTEKLGSPVLVQVTPSSHFGLSPRNRARALTRDRLRRIGGPRIAGRLANALESHALAVAAGDPRTAIINLWTALEAISGSSENQSICRKVASTIAPLVAWRRIDKIVTYLALSFHEVLVKEQKYVAAKVMTRSKRFTISQDDVLQGLCGPHGNPVIVYMLGQLNACPLLRQRLYAAWKSFTDPLQVRNDLQASRRRVEWQLQRLYRARNLLVHKGEQSHLIWRLLQNGQYYVSISLSRVLHDLADMPVWDIDASLEYQSMRFDHVCKGLAERKETITHADLLGARSKSPESLVWP